jgi:hypothetical protein
MKFYLRQPIANAGGAVRPIDNEIARNVVCSHLARLRGVVALVGAVTMLASTLVAAQPGVANYQGLWWAAPAGSQPGWGINIAHQGDVIFATWFTYQGRFHLPQWLSMTATRTSDNEYSGNLVLTTGSPYSDIPYNNGAFNSAPFVGSATLKFDSPTTGTLIYTPGVVEFRQPITLMVFGPTPTCVWGGLADLTKATNYTDLWWASPPGSESGWGISLTHQGNAIFAVWFTYDGARAADWMSATAFQTGPATYQGILYRTTGPNWGTLPFDSADVAYVAAGAVSLTFLDGNNARFTYSVNVNGGAGQSIQVKEITRQVFRPPGTTCS